MKKKSIAIIGSGPSALIASVILSKENSVTIYEKNRSVGSKFLIAGKGGLNITNSLEGKELADKYTPREFMEEAILSFDSRDLRNWLSELGIETFVGTSGRIFPVKGTKPATVLNKIKDKILSRGVKINYQSEFIGFDENKSIKINCKGNIKTIEADYFIFALGGASWSSTGSDGKWTKYFEDINLNIIPFQSSNCGVNIGWNENIIKKHAGKPLKNISISVGSIVNKGEAVITEYGLEGNVIYPLIREIRRMLNLNEKAIIKIDFKPNNSIEELLKKAKGKNVSSGNYAKIFNLKREQLAIIKNYLSKEEYLSAKDFVKKIKSLNIEINSLRDIEEAISTVGGIDIKELKSNFSVKKYPNIFCIGEMVDWDAPTGGYLLQGAFSMGYFSAKSILQSIKREF